MTKKELVKLDGELKVINDLALSISAILQGDYQVANQLVHRSAEQVQILAVADQIDGHT